MHDRSQEIIMWIRLVADMMRHQKIASDSTGPQKHSAQNEADKLAKIVERKRGRIISLVGTLTTIRNEES